MSASADKTGLAMILERAEFCRKYSDRTVRRSCSIHSRTKHSGSLIVDISSASALSSSGPMTSYTLRMYSHDYSREPMGKKLALQTCYLGTRLRLYHNSRYK